MEEQESSENETKSRPNESLFKLKELKSFDTEFISKYESSPELWDVKNRSYNNKYIRQERLQALLGIYRKYNPLVNLYDVRMKINSLRSNYRKLLKKYLSSKQIGVNGEECYTFVPSNWKFYALRFLGGESELEEGSIITDSSLVDNTEDVIDEENGPSSDSEDSQVLSSSAGHSQVSYRKRSTNPDLTLSSNKKTKVEPLGECNVDDMSEKELKAIAANVVYKLRRMSSEQRCHAELLINKVLLNGLRNILTYNTDLAEVDVQNIKVFQT